MQQNARKLCLGADSLSKGWHERSEWRARQDSNLQPSSSKPDTLSSWATSAAGEIVMDSHDRRKKSPYQQLFILQTIKRMGSHWGLDTLR